VAPSGSSTGLHNLLPVLPATPKQTSDLSGCQMLAGNARTGVRSSQARMLPPRLLPVRTPSPPPAARRQAARRKFGGLSVCWYSRQHYIASCTPTRQASNHNLAIGNTRRDAVLIGTHAVALAASAECLKPGCRPLPLPQVPSATTNVPQSGLGLRTRR
jgi:hypothetical protein